jgi:hypothetical protein
LKHGRRKVQRTLEAASGEPTRGSSSCMCSLGHLRPHQAMSLPCFACFLPHLC